MIYFIDDPGYREEYFIDAWSSFIRKNSSYLTHTLVDINDMMSDVVSILHLSLNMADLPKPPDSPLCSPTKPGMSPRRRSKARNSELNFMMSPIIYGVGGEIEKFYSCDICKRQTMKIENFISLNFKKLTIKELQQVREKFKDEGYSEGIKFQEIATKTTSVLQRIFTKKKVQEKRPIATIRDYLCHLNLIQKESVQ